MSKLWSAVGLVLIAGGCAGNACSCAGPLPNGFPAAERHPNAVQVRITDTGVQFLENNAATVLNAVVPGGLTFQVPESCGGDPEICCGQPAAECGIVIDLDPRAGDPPRLEIDPLASPGNRVHMVVRARVRTTDHLNVKFSGIDCEIRINSENDNPPSMTVVADGDLVQDAVAGTTRLVVVSSSVSDVDNGDLDLGGGFLCDLADVDFIKGFVIDQFIGQIEGTIQDAVADGLCKGCASAGECMPFATCNGGGTCELPSGDCLQELGVSGRVEARNLLASLSPGQEGAADIYDVAGGYARTNNGGISLGLLGGAVPPDGVRHPCVPGDDPPAVTNVLESAAFQGNTVPVTGTPFHVGIGVHEYHLNQNAWAMYQGGVLCINAGSRTIDQLNSATLALIVGSIADLTHSETAPVVIAVRPQKRPLITLGAGTFNPDGTILEPLINVNWPALQLDFFTLVEERYVRLFTLQTDLVLPIGLDVDDMGQLVPVLGNVEGAFTNLVVTNNELVEETPEELAQTFPTLLGLALPFLGSAFGSIAVPSLGGLEIRITPDGITSVDGHTMLALYGNLAVGAKPGRATVAARVTDVYVPPLDAYPGLDRERRPTVELELGGIGTDGTDRNLEWQVRVDGGFWSPYRRTRRLIVDDAVFWMAGSHRLEVRSRQRGRPETTSEITALAVDLDPRPRDPAGETVGFHGRLPDDGGCACEAAPRGASGGGRAALLLGALALAVWAFRKKSVTALALACALGPGCTCGSDSADCTSPAGAEDVVPGSIGRWSDVAASGGTVVISAYEQEFGDLVIGRRVDEGAIEWKTVDGVPEGPVVGTCDGYRGGIRDPGPDVGAHTSIALHDGRALIAYHDRGAGALKFAWQDGNEWTRYTVDAKAGEVIGLYTSVSVDAQGVPGIAYMATNLDDAGGGKQAQLRWAQASRAWPGANEWAIETIHESPIPCAGLCAGGLVCVTETNLCTATDTTCPAACAADVEACVAGACVAISPLPTTTDLPEGTGLFSSAGRLANGKAVVAFYDRTNGDLNLAVREPPWAVTPLDAVPETDVGQWASLAVTGGTVNVAYQDAVGDRLLAISWTDGTVGPVEVIDDGRREGDRPHSVGANASLVSTPSGLLVAYQDQTLSDLLVATRDAGGVWSWQAVASGAPGFGFYTAAARGDQTWISNYVYDRAAAMFGEIRLVNR